MTVCIAAMAQQYIVAVSDMMINGTTLASDGICRKQEAISSEWTAMMAGNDISLAGPIIARASEYMEGKPNSLKSIRSCFKRAFQQQLTEVATDRFLGRFGLDMKAFLKDGKRKFDPVTFASLCSEIRSVNLSDLFFLVWGFDDDGTPHIFMVHGAGEDALLDKPGFGAIGSGAFAAESLLFYLNQSRLRTLHETIANTCAAKFLAERAGVGRETFIFAARLGSVAFWSRAGYVEEMRREWESSGAPRIPDGVSKILERADIKCLTREESLKEFLRDPEPTRHDPQSPPASRE
jgi:hypothetical protein